MSLPQLLLLVATLLIVASVGALVYLGFGIIGVLVYVLAVCAVILSGLALYGLAKWLVSRRSTKLTNEMVKEASKGPAGFEDRSQVEELRQKFLAGLKQFEETGRDLYHTPWYIMVGEPGAGKTEAIRHSEILTDDFKDSRQGVGGTYSMDWWFTKEGIILDTAGAILTEEDSASRFTEFLELLRQHRPDRPIDGLMLAVPVESLLQDDPKACEHDARRVRKQLGVIQEALDLRFPLYVLITKCDKIAGFRAFFDAPGNEDFKRQMVGWSNPAELDQAIAVSRAAEAVERITDRLRMRRLALLREPVAVKPNGRRIDEVDALYTFPEAFQDTAPRLKAYLDVLFAAEEWKSASPFFRGVYFTSSLTEGAALDRELAAALHIPVQSLPPTLVAEHQRSFFLRDFFTKKLFAESGLVQHMTDMGRILRRKLLRRYGKAAAVLAILLGVSLFLAHRLGKDIEKEEALWKRAAAVWAESEDGSVLPLFEAADPTEPGTWDYRGAELVKEGYEDRRWTFHQRIAGLAHGEMGAQVWFSLLPRHRRLVEDRQIAQLSVIESGVIRPIVAAARAKMKLQPNYEQANVQDIEVLLALVELEKAIHELDAVDVERAGEWLYDLYAFARAGAPADEAPAPNEKALREMVRSVYGGLRWSERRNLSEKTESYAAIDVALSRFAVHWPVISRTLTENLDNTLERRPAEVEKMRNREVALRDDLTIRIATTRYEGVDDRLHGLRSDVEALDGIPLRSAGMEKSRWLEIANRLMELAAECAPPLKTKIEQVLGNHLEDAARIAARTPETEVVADDQAFQRRAYLNEIEGEKIYRRRYEAYASRYPPSETNGLVQPKPLKMGGVQEVLTWYASEYEKAIEAAVKILPPFPTLDIPEPDPAAPAPQQRETEVLARELEDSMKMGQTICEELLVVSKEHQIAEYLESFRDALKAMSGTYFPAPFALGYPLGSGDMLTAAEFTEACAVLEMISADVAAALPPTLGNHYRIRGAQEGLAAIEKDLGRVRDFRNFVGDAAGNPRVIMGVLNEFKIPDDVQFGRNWLKFGRREEKGRTEKTLRVRINGSEVVPQGGNVALELSKPLKLEVQTVTTPSDGDPSVDTLPAIEQPGPWGTLRWIENKLPGGGMRAVIPLYTVEGYPHLQLTLTLEFESPLPPSSSRIRKF